MQRLGFWHVWNTIQSPTGLHFYLDLEEPEQKDIAKDVVKMGCKATMAAKAQNSAQGLSQVRGAGGVAGCLQMLWVTLWPGDGHV